VKLSTQAAPAAWRGVFIEAGIAGDMTEAIHLKSIEMRLSRRIALRVTV